MGEMGHRFQDRMDHGFDFFINALHDGSRRVTDLLLGLRAQDFQLPLNPLEDCLNAGRLRQRYMQHPLFFEAGFKR